MSSLDDVLGNVIKPNGCLNMDLKALIAGNNNYDDINKLLNPRSTSVDLYYKIMHSFISKSSEMNERVKRPVKGIHIYQEITRDDYIYCTILNEFAETEYMYYVSSRTAFEDMLIQRGLQNAKDANTAGKRFPRVINYYKYFCVDTTFPLFKNLFYLESNRARVRSKNLSKEHYEINLYYIIPFILYYITGNYYDNDKFLQQYTEEEYFLFNDLMTSLVLEIITQKELKILEKLINRDPVLSELLSVLDDRIKESTKYNNIYVSINIEFLDINLTSHLFVKDKMDLLREFICICMERVLAGVFIYCKRLTTKSFLSIKSFSDFRIIGAMTDVPFSKESSYSKKDLVIDKYFIKLVLPDKENCNSVYYLNLFKGSEALEYVKKIQSISKSRPK